MILLASKVALPHRGVRMLFSLLAYFSTISTFSLSRGDILYAHSFEEILIVIAYSLAGLLVPKSKNSRIGDTEIEVHNLKIVGKDPARYIAKQASPLLVHGIA